MTMTRDQALPYIAYAVDSALCERAIADMPANARLVGWQCGFEPLFVAVWSYLGDTHGNLDRVEDYEAEDIAADLLLEKRWFGGDVDVAPDADYIL